ncbi:sodium- and chloride-dependent neutral and basic amino acid transporter B(0+) [Paramormyrops kingsleyae]|uniref:Transporter n=1 Tax=Paramormyrops kingsleyae TaxID=1676925 RepID=A0A3B3RKU2_9TELE|nr:sodium- and chloride-dependent neutral and basic amino acid transporter B(0+)-like [Paramormyrops kingsleyae]XP_023688148.1 sodium- and chloride-dependent neutral and basic amino acid transporter B(0+)-like [Paramormyrops kingsleyae]XP_023688149.1 sodium- and chloride-dependent neutral and basic amino acid transporter B(0+)-like [Paramormyrops kingsleyae]
MTKRGLNYFSYLIFKNPDTERHPDVQNGVCQKKDDSGGRDENVERGNWASKREYILSMIGYAVGLGNVWRFPYLAYRNGGGAFLIPYFTMLLVAGLPVFLMECSLGQFCSQGPINVWMAVPIMQGVGITMVLVSSLVAIYYNVIIAYSIYYMFASFQSPLPWSNYAIWSDENCSLTPRDDGSSVVNMMQNTTFPEANISSVPVQNPSERYWNEVVLQRSGGLGETGEIVWPLGLCLLLAWVLIGGALYKGIKSSGKVVYFTATFPYVVLFILLVRGLTLEGARDGIQYYIGSQSNLTKLMEAEVWRDAATQIFYSLSVAWGGLTALSSYNKFKNNCYKDCIIVCLTNCGTSIFAGFAIFSILGHMAHVYEKPVPEVVESGFALAFVAYPEALSKLPVSPLWSILFFFMLLTLGLDSQFASIETITTSIQDAFPRLFRSKRFHITVATCAILFLIGLPCVTRAGIYWVKLLDHFCAGWILLVTALLELIGLSYIYGANRFIKDIEMMIGTRSALFWLWWRACWLFITPCVLSVILVWSLSSFTPPTYGSVVYPRWGLSLGWCLLTFCLIWIPIVSMWKLWKADGSLWQRCKVVCTPTDKWGPYLEIHRTERYAQRRALQISPSIEMSAPSDVSSTSCGLATPSEPLNYSTLF